MDESVRGPIPARAGEPPLCRRHKPAFGAYPRSRGGTLRARKPCIADLGLSPLARGNRHTLHQCCAQLGPIPARAGEPLDGHGLALGQGAYPRSRGGTTRGQPSMRRASGLSPLARGNLREMLELAALAGPIPARAGEPWLSATIYASCRAYPRSRGGTRGLRWMMEPIQGLSPLARGNLICATFTDTSKRPIPARAGEPNSSRLPATSIKAYPRSRGGTFDSRPWPSSFQGLSPLARGNLTNALSYSGFQGPIPARAGEPILHPCQMVEFGAYPRSRGGTALESGDGLHDSGLSPLARGNPEFDRLGVQRVGPIPARAGEPNKTRKYKAF